MIHAQLNILYKRVFVFFLIIQLNLVHSQNTKFYLEPNIGNGTSTYSFKNNPYIDTKYPLKNKRFDPLAIDYLLLGINAGINYKEKKSVSIGISQSHSGFGYHYNLGSYTDTSFLTNGTYIIEKQSFGTKTLVLKNTTKYSIHFSQVLFPSSKKKKENIDVKLNKHRLKFAGFSEFSLLSFRKQNAYIQQGDLVYDIFSEKTIGNDTLLLIANSREKNTLGCSVSLGFNLFYYFKEKNITKLNLYFEQGLTTLYTENIFIYKKSILEYQNSIFSKGSKFYIGLQFPITVFRFDLKKK